MSVIHTQMFLDAFTKLQSYKNCLSSEDLRNVEETTNISIKRQLYLLTTKSKLTTRNLEDVGILLYEYSTIKNRKERAFLLSKKLGII